MGFLPWSFLMLLVVRAEEISKYVSRNWEAEPVRQVRTELQIALGNRWAQVRKLTSSAAKTAADRCSSMWLALRRQIWETSVCSRVRGR